MSGSQAEAVDSVWSSDRENQHAEPLDARMITHPSSCTTANDVSTVAPIVSRQQCAGPGTSRGGIHRCVHPALPSFLCLLGIDPEVMLPSCSVSSGCTTKPRPGLSATARPVLACTLPRRPVHAPHGFFQTLSQLPQESSAL